MVKKLLAKKGKKVKPAEKPAEKAKTKVAPKPELKAVAAGNAPKFKLRAVYLKDVSFESPNSPQVFGVQLPTPKIRLEVNVNVAHVEASAFEVAIRIEAEAKLPDNKTLFLVELVQGGIFVLNPEIPQEKMKEVLGRECANALFPFARQAVAEITRNGGFAPLVLDQLDFAA